MTATPARRALVSALLGASVLTAALPGSAALATAVPTASPTASPTAAATAGPSPTATRLPALPAPVLQGPTGYASTLKDVVLDWRAVPGAAAYEVEVGVDDGWSGTPVWSATTVSTQVSVPSWLPQADYVWRVAGQRPGGTGRWSADGGFRRGWDASPTPLRPAPQEGVVGQYPEFRWTPVEGASGYEVQVSDSPSFSEDGLPGSAPSVPAGAVEDQSPARVDTCFTTHTRVTPFEGNASSGGASPGPCSWTLLGTGEPRWWRVRALDRPVDEAPGEVATQPASDEGVSHVPPRFDGQPDPDVVTACPVGTAPGSELVAPGAEPAPSPSPSASPAPSGSPVPSPTASAGARAPGSCEPAAAADQGRWSAAHLFTVRLDAVPDASDRFRTLPRPVLQPLTADAPCSAADGAVLCTDVPTVRWDPVPGAYAYRVSLSRTRTFSNVVLTADVPGLSFTPTHSLPDTTAGAALFVGVQACTTAGCGAVTSDPPSFRKRTPAVALAAPAEGSALAAGDVVLRWQTLHDALEQAAAQRGTSERAATQGATGYRLQVTREDDPGFRTPVEDVVVDQPLHATLDAVYGDGAFLWRVQALDGSEHPGAWSAPATFRRDTVAPVATVVTTSPARADAPFVLRFSEPVRGLGPAVVRVPGAGVRVVVADDRTSVALWPKGAWTPGRGYRLELTAGVTDEVGNPAAPLSAELRADPVVQDGSALLGYAGAWGFRRGTDASGGSFRTSFPTPTAPTAVTTVVHGRGAEVLGCRGPSGGLVDVWVDGLKRRRIDTYQRWSSCGVVLARVELPLGDHHVQLRGVGRKRSASSGTTASVDAVRAL